LIVCAVGMAPTSARADEPYEPKVIPKCAIYRVGTIDICGFTFEEWKKVLEADAELVHVRAELKNEERRSAGLALQVEALQEQVETYAKSQAVLIARNEKLLTDQIALDKKYQDERVKPRLGSPVAWSITTIAVAVLGGFVLRAKL
jgi:hypothetical protein